MSHALGEQGSRVCILPTKLLSACNSSPTAAKLLISGMALVLCSPLPKLS